VLLLSGGGCVIVVTFREFHDLDQEISAEIVSFTPRALPYNIFLNQKNEFILKRQQNEMLRIAKWQYRQDSCLLANIEGASCPRTYMVYIP
jgi:hypothetical protein